jgi:polyferredoxin
MFTGEPLLWWLIISVLQTFVLIPLGIYFYGKGVYCGWICSCGAMAETLGDTHRHKMPHGPVWNRVNMIGQVFLAVAVIMMTFRIVSWIWPDSWFGHAYLAMLGPSKYNGIAVLNYAWFVDLFWAGILGFGLYFNFSGRVWCRFACPLAALMHIYARFSQFRIIADKGKCISCNVCTSVCHQGIDIMNFANKGLPMEDPECVRCSACVQSCPTGVLQFGRINRKTGDVIAYDTLQASPVLMAEIRVNGKRMEV